MSQTSSFEASRSAAHANMGLYIRIWIFETPGRTRGKSGCSPFLSTSEICCFWSGSWSHLRLKRSDSGRPAGSVQPPDRLVNWAWRIKSSQEGPAPSTSQLLLPASRKQIVAYIQQFYCLSSNIPHCLNEESPNIFTSRKAIWMHIKPKASHFISTCSKAPHLIFVALWKKII